MARATLSNMPDLGYRWLCEGAASVWEPQRHLSIEAARFADSSSIATQTSRGACLELGVVTQHERLKVGGVDVIQALLRVAVRRKGLLRVCGRTLRPRLIGTADMPKSSLYTLTSCHALENREHARSCWETRTPCSPCSSWTPCISALRTRSCMA